MSDFNPNEISRFDPAKGLKNKRHFGDRKPKLTLRALNTLKKMQLLQQSEEGQQPNF